MRLLLVAALLLGSAVVGVPAEGDDVPMTEWCESAGIPGERNHPSGTTSFLTCCPALPWPAVAVRTLGCM